MEWGSWLIGEPGDKNRINVTYLFESYRDCMHVFNELTVLLTNFEIVVISSISDHMVEWKNLKVHMDMLFTMVLLDNGSYR